MSRRGWGWIGAAVLAALGLGATVVFLALVPTSRHDTPAQLGWTPLMDAAREGELEEIQALVAEGADPDRHDRQNGWTALFHAIHARQPAAARALIAAGADVEARTRHGLTPLMMAAGDGQREIVESLLAAGADPYARGPHRMNALIGAEISGDPAVKSALLRAAPDLPQHTNPALLRLARVAHWGLSFLPKGLP